jgi:hypothetical protein
MTNNNRQARPWDLLNPNIKHVSKDIESKRLEICKICPKFIKSTSQCRECGCIMVLKTKLPNAYCPLEKWGAIKEENK